MREKFCTENFAVVGPDNDVFNDLVKFNDCTVYQIENPIFTAWLHTPVPRNSPYKKVFDHL